MAKPTTVGWHRLKRLGRYLVGSGRTVRALRGCCGGCPKWRLRKRDTLILFPGASETGSARLAHPPGWKHVVIDCFRARTPHRGHSRWPAAQWLFRVCALEPPTNQTGHPYSLSTGLGHRLRAFATPSMTNPRGPKGVSGLRVMCGPMTVGVHSAGVEEAPTGSADSSCGVQRGSAHRAPLPLPPLPTTPNGHGGVPTVCGGSQLRPTRTPQGPFCLAAEAALGRPLACDLRRTAARRPR